MHRLEQVEIGQLRQQYVGGSTIRELAETFRVHRSTVTALLERGSVARRRKGLSPNEAHLAAQLYEEGLSFATIGKRLGFSGDTVRRRLYKEDIAIRRHFDWHYLR
jgi:DNA-directed RNA polymerase specialized sigma24 family protein